MRRTWHVAAAVALTTAVTGCGVVDDLRTTGFAKQDGAEIATEASRAMADVTSMRLTGQVRVGGNPILLDLSMDEQSCTGSMRFDKGHFAVRRVGKQAWVKGDATAYSRIAATPLSSAALGRLSTTWIAVDDRAVLRLCDLDSFLDSFTLVEPSTAKGTKGRKGTKGGEDATPASGVSLDNVSVGEETSQDGDRVVPILTTPTETVWVLSKAPHYVIRVEDATPRTGGSVNFSEFNRDVVVEAPRAQDVFTP